MKLLFLFAAAATAIALDAPAVHAAAPARIGVVHLGAAVDAPVVQGLRQGLRELGYTEGKDFVLDIRAGRGDKAAALAGARELVKAQVQVVVSAGTVATQAAQSAGGSMPIVFTQVGEPVAAGFVKSLQRPGGNLTGFSHLLAETSGKRLEILKELVPSARSVLVMFDPANPTSQNSVAVAQKAAKKLAITLRERHVRNPGEVSGAIDQTNRKTADAVLVLPDSLVANAGDRIIEMARRERIPVMFHEATWVDRGGFASYGASFTDLGRRAAGHVDKILKGARPEDLPIEQPTKFDLVVNKKTAAALGIAIPQTILLRADKVIE